MKKRKVVLMKKVVAVLLMVALIAGILTGCGSNETGESETWESNTTDETKKEVKTIKYDDFHEDFITTIESGVFETKIIDETQYKYEDGSKFYTLMLKDKYENIYTMNLMCSSNDYVTTIIIDADNDADHLANYIILCASTTVLLPYTGEFKEAWDKIADDLGLSEKERKDHYYVEVGKWYATTFYNDEKMNFNIMI